MKPSTEWTEEDIDNLITAGTNESSSLEYKQCSALRTQGIACRVQDQALVEMDHTQSKDKIVSEISKDVSSFANADGGTIIYGIVEDKHLPFCIDPHPFDPSELPKETLENIIDSNIKRKIEGVIINPIELRHSNPGKVIYAVSIPQSLQGAHQANDLRYYQRRNFKCEPMEDYQVRDVMNRFRFPVLEADIYFKNPKHESHEHWYAIGLRLNNIGNVPALNFGVDLYIPTIVFPNLQVYRGLPGKHFSKHTVMRQGCDCQKMCYRNFGPDYLLFPTESITILDPQGDNSLVYTINDTNSDKANQYPIECMIFADNMPPKSQTVPIFQDF